MQTLIPCKLSIRHLGDSSQSFRRGLLVAAFLLAQAGFAFGQSEAPSVRFTEVMYSGAIRSGRPSRSALATDMLFHKLALGKLAPPQMGESSGTGFRGEPQVWEKLEIAEPTKFSAGTIRGGFVYLKCESDLDQTILIKPNGFSQVVINGRPFPGDLYGKGWQLLPVKIRKGENEFWCKPGRGRNRFVWL